MSRVACASFGSGVRVLDWVAFLRFQCWPLHSWATRRAMDRLLGGVSPRRSSGACVSSPSLILTRFSSRRTRCSCSPMRSSGDPGTASRLLPMHGNLAMQPPNAAPQPLPCQVPVPPSSGFPSTLCSAEANPPASQPHGGGGGARTVLWHPRPTNNDLRGTNSAGEPPRKGCRQSLEAQADEACAWWVVRFASMPVCSAKLFKQSNHRADSSRNTEA